MNFIKFLKFLLIITFVFSTIGGCKKFDWDGDFEPDGKKRARKNVKEGKGITGPGGLFGSANKRKGGSFEFASSNELWRASLDTLDFMSFSNVDYSGGLTITDWYSDNQNDSIKITLRFLSNEIRSDAISVKIFYKKCDPDMKCIITDNKENLEKEIKKEILKKAAIYKKQTKDKNFKPYSNDLDQSNR